MNSPQCRKELAELKKIPRTQPMLHTRHFSLMTINAAVVLATASGAFAQARFPERPIKLVLPTVAGGWTDSIARLAATEIAKQTGWTIVVDNRSGADGAIGADLVTKAAPDGYTILLSASGHLLLPIIRKKLPFDTLKDFAPVTALTKSSGFLVTSIVIPVKTVGELNAMLKASLGKYSYSTAESYAYSSLSATTRSRECKPRVSPTGAPHNYYLTSCPALSPMPS
jgi:tripartite-type tricarboxylate transporter receptor subunit TctC